MQKRAAVFRRLRHYTIGYGTATTYLLYVSFAYLLIAESACVEAAQGGLQGPHSAIEQADAAKASRQGARVAREAQAIYSVVVSLNYFQFLDAGNLNKCNFPARIDVYSAVGQPTLFGCSR
jgi:hypothetical protein